VRSSSVARVTGCPFSRKRTGFFMRAPFRDGPTP
jgi:hypothetical protein